MLKKNKEGCCGCSACYAVCPKGAIAMEPDEEGFLYPVIDPQRCVSCGLCEGVCAFTEDYPQKLGLPSYEKAYYAGRAEDPMTVRRSRSGGMFIALAEKVLGRGGVVYGVALDPALRAVLRRVEDEAQLYLLQGSKYVQADMKDGFATVRADLTAGRQVFFAGTACQVAGLVSYLRSTGCSTEGLLTADLICHGVPSPKIWQDNLEDLTRRWGKRPVVANFRDKRLGWRSHIESYELEDSRGRRKTRYSNRFTTLFCSGAILRPACHDCKYCNFDRPGDVSLGDFWGFSRAGMKVEPQLGLSQLMVNSEKGAEWIRDLPNARLSQVSREAFSEQPNLFAPTAKSPRREAFWQLYRDKGYRAAARKFEPVRERVKVIYNRVKCLKYRKKDEREK